MKITDFIKDNQKIEKKELEEQEDFVKKEKKKKLNPWTFINQIQYKTSKHPYDKKVGSAYLTSLYFSHDDRLISMVNEINSLQFLLKDSIIYEYYMDKVPKGKRYLPWTKKTPEQKKFTKSIEKLMRENNEISKREAIIIQKQKERLSI